MCGALETGFGIFGSSLGAGGTFRQGDLDEFHEAFRRLCEGSLGTVALAERNRADSAVCSDFTRENESLDADGRRTLEHVADDLPGERRRVEPTLPGDDEIDACDFLVEPEPGGDEVEARDEPR